MKSINTGIKEKMKRGMAAVLGIVMSMQMVLGDILPAMAAVSEDGSRPAATVASPPDADWNGGIADGAMSPNEDKKQESGVSIGGYLVFMTEEEPDISSVRLELYSNGHADSSKKAVIKRLNMSGADIEERYLSREMTLEGAAFPVWSYVFEDLPEQDADGNTYTYSVRDAGYQVATPSDAQYATPGDARYAAFANALYYRSEDGKAEIADGRTSEDVMDFIFVERRTVEGIYMAENEGQGLPEDASVQLEVSAGQEEDMEWLDDEVTASVNVKEGLWKAENCPRFNPETGEEINYRAAVSLNARDYEASYENVGTFFEEDEYAYEGGTIINRYTGEDTFHAVGIVRFEHRNYLASQPDFEHLLKVYQGQRDVTASVDITWKQSDAREETWNYEIAGLIKGQEYTVVPEQMEGCTVEPERVPVIIAAMRSRGAEMNALLMPIAFKAAEPKDVIIKNTTYSEDEADIKPFTYEVKIGDTPYSGRYEILTVDGVIKTSGTVDNGIIVVEKGESIKLSALENSTVSIEQQRHDTTTVFGSEVRDITIVSDESKNTVTYVNTQMVPAYITKIWNDNGDENKVRPGRDEYPSLTTLFYQTDDMPAPVAVTTANMGSLGLTALPMPEVPSEGVSEINRWKLTYNNLPYTDEDGNEIHYTAKDQVAGYHMESGTDPDVAEGVPFIRNTSYKVMTAHKTWKDNENSYKTRLGTEEFRESLALYQRQETNAATEIPVNLDDPSGENYIGVEEVVGADGQKEYQIRVTNLIAYDADGLPYTYYIKEKLEAMPVSTDNTLADLNTDVSYKSEYENVGNYAAREDGCYDGGVIRNVLVGEMPFEAKKIWQDEVEKGQEEAERPDAAIQLWRYPKDTDGADPSTATQVGNDITVMLPKNKSPYIIKAIDFLDRGEYLDRFDANGTEYVYFIREKLTGTASSEYGQFVYDADGMMSEDGLLHHGGTLYNRKNGTENLSVTKTWLCASYQTIKAKVELSAQRKLVSAPDIESNWETVINEDGTPAMIILDGFSSEAMSRQGVFEGLPQYSDEGEKYEYRVMESGIYITDSNGEFQPVIFDREQETFVTSDGHYRFKMLQEVSDEGSSVTLKNQLIGTMELTIQKKWESKAGWENYIKEHPDYKTTLGFHILQNGKDYCGKSVSGTCTKPEVVMENVSPGSPESELTKVIRNLPKYDENGAEYLYTVAEAIDETMAGDTIYKYETYDASNFYNNRKAIVANYPPGGQGQSVKVQKIWQDGSDVQHWQEVHVRLYDAATMQPVDGTEAVLNDSTGWIGRVPVPAGKDPKDYVVREYLVGDAKTGADGKKLGTVIYDNSDSDASGDNLNLSLETGNGEFWTEDHWYDVKTEKAGDGSYIITNTRKGKITINLKKTWIDGENEDGKRDSATYQIKRDGNYVDGQLRTVESGTSWEVTWENLPKYDEKGQLHVYEVEEVLINNEPSDGTYASSVTLPDSVVGPYHTGDTVAAESTNQKTGTVESFTIHKIWLDENGQDGVPRPDIFLKLYREYFDPEKGESIRELVGTYYDRVWTKHTTSHFSYTFDPLPNYTEYGYEIKYSVEEGMHVTGDYKTYYDQEEPKDDGISMNPDHENKDGRVYADGTIVNRREATTSISGRKIWTNMDGLALKDVPEVTIQLLQNTRIGGKNQDKEVVAGAEKKILSGKTDESQKYKYEDLPKYNEKGQRLYYSVQETAINGDEGLVGIFDRAGDGYDYVIQNTYNEVGDFAVDVTKNWDTDNSGDMKPSGKYDYPEIKVTLWRRLADADGNIISTYPAKKVNNAVPDITLNSDGAPAEIVFKNLPKYAPNGREWIYYVKEESIGGYKIINSTPFGDGAEEVSTVIPGNDDPNKGTAELTNSYEEQDYDYTEISVVKTWADDGNKYGLRPMYSEVTAENPVKLELWRKSEKAEEEKVSDAVLQWIGNHEDVSPNTWTGKFTLPGSNGKFPKYAPDGTLYTYSVKETLGDNDAYQIGQSTGGEKDGGYICNIKNTLKLTELRVTKAWVDENNQYGSRPGQIEVQIERSEDDGVTWTKDWGDNHGKKYLLPSKKLVGEDVNKDDKWENMLVSGVLPACDSDGNIYKYRACELLAAGQNYTSTYGYEFRDTADKSVGKTTIANTLTTISPGPGDNTLKFIATKKWDDSGNIDGLRPDTITVRLVRDGKSLAGTEKTIDITGEETTFTWVNLPRYQDVDVAEESVYEVEEVDKDGLLKYYTPSYGAVASAGSPVMEFTQTIINTHNKINGIVEVEKKWDHEEDGHSSRPDSLIITLMKHVGEETPVSTGKTAALSEDTGWKARFDSLSYADSTGKPIYYSVAEADIEEGKTAGDDTLSSCPGYSLTKTEMIPENGLADVKGGSDETHHTLKITLTNSLKTTSLTVEKFWEGEGIVPRPAEITVTLYRSTDDGASWTEVKDSSVKIGTGKNENTYTYRNLPAYDKDGTSYVYEARETGVEQETEVSGVVPKRIGSYSVKESTTGTEGDPEKPYTTTITNTMISAADIVVEKKWEDGNNQDGLRLSEIEVALYKDGNEVTAGKQLLSETNNWSYKWTNLPKYQKDGVTECRYMVKEVSVLPAGYSADDSGEVVIVPGTPGIITNRYTPRTMTVTAVKKWEGDKKELRPQEIKLTLQQTVDPAGSWESVGQKTIQRDSEEQTVSWDNLPIRRLVESSAGSPSESKEIHYRVVEEPVSGYSVKYTIDGGLNDVTGDITQASDSGVNKQSIMVTNTLMTKTSATVKKIWIDGSGSDTRDEVAEITYRLQRKLSGEEDSAYKDVTKADVGYTDDDVICTIKASAPEEKQSYTFAELPRYSPDGAMYSYRVTESSMKLTSDEVLAAEMVSGTEGTVGAYTYEIAYTPDGTGVGSDGESVTTITNVLMLRDINVAKSWEDTGNQDGRRPDNITLELKKKAREDQTVTVEKTMVLDGIADGNGEDAPWHGTWKNLPYAYADGAPIEYSVAEIALSADSGYEAAVVTAVDDDADRVLKKTDVLVKNQRTPESTSFTVQKYWVGDEDWKEDTRPDSIQVQLYKTVNKTRTAVGEPVVIREDDGWSCSWTNLPKYENPEGTETNAGKSYQILYTVEEVTGEEFGYTAVASGANAIKNTLKTTGLTVEKYWSDLDDYYGTRPDHITIQLERRLRGQVGNTGWSRVAQIQEEEMSRTDDWSRIDFIGLPTHNKKGEAYEYRAIETKIGGQTVKNGQADGYRVSYRHTPNVGTVPGTTEITNTLRAGGLEVTKIQTGSSSPAEFTFHVKLSHETAEFGFYTGDYRVYAKDADIASAEYTAGTAVDGAIHIKGGEKFYIEKIPAGWSYEVTEELEDSYRNTDKSGDTGMSEDKAVKKAVFTNEYVPSNTGGDHGGSSHPGGPSQPGKPGGPGEEPTTPADPTDPTVPVIPDLPEIPSVNDPNGGTIIELPDTIPPDCTVEVDDVRKPGEPVYKGPLEPGNQIPVQLPPGTYVLTAIDDNDVPLGKFLINIDDNQVPLGLPKAGDGSVPVVWLAVLVLAALAGTAALRKKRKKLEEDRREGE